MSIRMFEIIQFIVYAGIALFIGWPLALAGTAMMTDMACLQAGYKSAKVDFLFNRYCIKRVNQTDKVVRLSDVTKN